MLSANNLREYCRTCLVKLERTNEDNSKSILINKFPDVEHLIQVCLSKTSVCEDSLCFYAPYLCCSCFDKWFDFTKLYQQAVKIEEQIRKVLEKEMLKTENIGKEYKQNENDNEYFINAESLVFVSNEVEKYETDSPFYTDSLLNNPIKVIKHKATTADVPENPNRHIKHNAINLLQLDVEHTEDDVSSSCLYAVEDIDFSSEPKDKKIFTIKKVQFKKSTRKPFCISTKTSKTRKSLLQVPENHVPPKEENKNIEDLGDIERKKGRYVCEQCSKYFLKKNIYDGHMKKVHEGIRRAYKCQECDKAYNLYRTLLQHKQDCHSEHVYKCDKCDKTYKTKVTLKRHVTKKHSEQKQAMRLICDQCGFITAHQQSLSRHIKYKHTKTDQIKCDQCPKVFRERYSLKYHVIRNHNSYNIKPFKCTECKKEFSKKALLNQHKWTHIKYTERIKCDFEGCEVRFISHGDKAYHMRLVHLKVKQHICDFCGEAFGAMQTLRNHRFIHTGEKPHKCRVCGQGFRQQTTMMNHRKTHFGKETESEDLINNLPEINF